MGPRQIFESSEVSLGVTSILATATAFSIPQEHAMVGVTHYGQMNIDASFVRWQVFGTVDAFGV